MDPKWLVLIGLIITLAGVIVLAWGLIISRKQALNVGVSRFAEESDKKNVSLPNVQNEIRKSRFALIGVILLSIGFLFQIIGNWLTIE
jgi:hypothetical protein